MIILERAVPIRFTVPVFLERVSISVQTSFSFLVLKLGFDCINSLSYPSFFSLTATEAVAKAHSCLPMK